MAHKAEPHLGYSSKINPVKCANGKEKTEYDVMNSPQRYDRSRLRLRRSSSATVAGLALVVRRARLRCSTEGCGAVMKKSARIARRYQS